MTRLERLHLLFSGGLNAVRDFGRHLLKKKLLLGFLATAALVCLTIGLSLTGPSWLRLEILSRALTATYDAWRQVISASLLVPPARGSHGSEESLLDLRIILALLLGAGTSFVCNFAWTTIRERRAGRAAGNNDAAGQNEVANGAVAGPGAQTFDIPDNACYFCIRRPATSKCGSCRLVYYCCRLCQMQAWRKHRHVCGAAAAAASRIHRSRSLISPSQWRDLVDYCDYVKGLVPSTTVVPTAPEMVARILHKIGGYIRQRPELVCQPMADAVWAAALSMRSEGLPDRLYMAWAWGFLEASVESGSADAFLAALRINEAGAADLPRVNRWMKRGLCQALLMLNKRQEVGGFFRAAPMQQLLYF